MIKIRFFRIFLMIWSIGMVACSAETESSGNCKLECSKKVIASYDYVITPVGDSVTVNCEGTKSMSFEARFLVTEKPVATSTGSSSSSTESTTKGLNVQTNVPKQGVGFRPLISGSIDEINTTQSDWCTDSCGIAKVAFTGKCLSPNDNNISVGIISGGASSKVVKFTLTGAKSS